MHGAVKFKIIMAVYLKEANVMPSLLGGQNGGRSCVSGGFIREHLQAKIAVASRYPKACVLLELFGKGKGLQWEYDDM